MKKIIVAGAALLMAGGGYVAADNAFAADDAEPGIKISGDARFRFTFRDKYDFGNSKRLYNGRNGGSMYGHSKKQNDSRIRIRFKATTAGGAYAVGRVRLADGINENNDTDGGGGQPGSTWADEAYIGVPITDDFTLEVGKYRVTYGTGFYYDDLPVAGARGIIKVGDWEINPFVEWQSDSAGRGSDGYGDDRYWDHDAIRYGIHAGGMIADGWKAGALVAYQSDSRDNNFQDENGNWHNGGQYNWSDDGHKGWMASVYLDGKSGPFGLKAEFAFNDGSLKHFNRWQDDAHGSWDNDLTSHRDYDTGVGGFIQPSYTIDALTLALNAGFAINGFTPDTNFGFIMLGSSQLAIQVIDINQLSKSTWWIGLVAKYAISDDLSVTGNFAYAGMDPYDFGANTANWGANLASLKHAVELSASLDYAVTKSLAFKWAIGTLFASFKDDRMKDDNPWGTLLQFNFKF